MAGFQQAALAVEKEKEFEELKGAIVRVLSPEKAETFLKQLQSAGIRVRDFDGVLAKGIIERVDGANKTLAAKLYQALPVSDQAQMREFYLSKIEEVDSALRTKFKKLYQYY